MTSGDDQTSAESAPPGAPMSDSEPRDHSEISFVGALNVALRYRYLIIACCGLAVGGVAVVSLQKPRTYTSRSSFTPQSRQAPTRLSEIAAQTGLGPAVGESSHSPQFYVDLLKSRYMMHGVVETEFTRRSDSGPITGTLMDVYNVSGTKDIRREMAVRRLQRTVTPDMFRRTSVVTLAVTAQTPSLARDINQRMLDLVNEFNTERRQLYASAERYFTETRMAEVRNSLRAAENTLQRFLEENRALLARPVAPGAALAIGDFGNSPVLTFQQQRLAREVDRQQRLYTAMSAAYEQARIDEVRDTPLITMFERPELPVWPDRRGLLKKSVVALIVGAMFGILMVFGVEFMRGVQFDQSTELALLIGLSKETLGDFLRPWRPVQRLFKWLGSWFVLRTHRRG